MGIAEPSSDEWYRVGRGGDATSGLPVRWGETHRSGEQVCCARTIRLMSGPWTETLRSGAPP